MGRPVAYRGARLTVAFAVARNGSAPALAFYDHLGVRDKARMNKLFQWLGDMGWINNKEKFKPIEGTGLFEFKDSQIRMPCYRSGSLMIVTHGFLKKRGRIPPEEIRRALRIQAEDKELEGGYSAGSAKGC